MIGLDCKARPKKFIIANDWYFSARFAAATLLSNSYRNCAIAALHPSKSRIVARIVRGNFESAYTTADAVNVRAHWRRTGLFRCFYRGKRPLSVKVSFGSIDGQNIIAHEHHVRAQIDRIGELRTPKIYGSSIDDHIAQLQEEWVGGRTAACDRDIGEVAGQLIPSLERHYERYGVKYESLSALLGEGFSEAIREVCDHVAWKPATNARDFCERIEGLEGQAKTFPVSLCHGDLNLGHVVLQRSRPPILIDWNAARETAIAVDIAELVHSCKVAQERLLGPSIRLLERLSRAGSYTAREQLFLISLRKVHGWREMQRRVDAEHRPSQFRTTMRRFLSLAEQVLPSDSAR
jgi:hypothetical protein